MQNLEQQLRAIMLRINGRDAPIDNCVRLTGGANMESWSFDWAGHGFVLRRAPNAEMMALRPFGHDIEAAIVRSAFSNGVQAPEIVAEIEPGDLLGTGYVMRQIEAEVNPAKILGAPPLSLLDDFARELAAIHAIPTSALPTLPILDAETAVRELKARFTDYGADRPVMALTIKWLEEHLLPATDPVLLHGDFRMGNIMVAENGLAAVLDWELAHFGDRHQDLAYGCINSWRFGHIDQPAFGIGSFKDFWAAYETHSGNAIDPVRFRFWLVYSTLWWGLCCLQMAAIWRSGLDAGLERAVIGRRASETEVDLLMLLEEDAPATERGPIALPIRAEPRRLGEPSDVELLEAVAAWVEAEIKPNAQGRDRFMASVALNALGMLQREASLDGFAHDKGLSDDLLMGRKSLATPGLLAQLKSLSLAKLAADQPKYSALKKARELWL